VTHLHHKVMGITDDLEALYSLNGGCRLGKPTFAGMGRRMRRFQTFARRGRREREVVPEFTDLRLRAEIDLALRLCPAAASRRGRSRPFCRVDFDPVD
jgi:hypothetical protein